MTSEGTPPRTPEPAAGPALITPRLATTVLTLEAFLVFFGLLVAVRLVDLPGAAVWTAGLALVLLCVAAAGSVRRSLVPGHVVQGLVLLSGLWVPAMAVMGAIFLALWVWLLVVGRRIDRDRLRWAAEGRPGPATDGTATDGTGGGPPVVPGER